MEKQYLTLKEIGTKYYVELFSVFMSLVLIIFTSYFCRDYFRKNVDKVFHLCENRDSLRIVGIDSLSNLAQMQKSELKFIIQNLQQSKNRNKLIVKEIIPYYFNSIMIFPFVTGILGVLVFLITQTGWRDAPVILKTFAITFALYSSLFGMFPTAFKQKENIDQNLKIYNTIDKIQNKIRDYALTHPVIYKEKLEFEKFINEINTESIDMCDFHFQMEQKGTELKLENFKG